MSTVIRISEDVAAELARRAEDDENPNDVVRRLLGFPPKADRRASRASSAWSTAVARTRAGKTS